MIGTTVSHYKILEKLGGGGMGVVYKAEDTRLKRTVALKFLPPDLTRDEEAKQRFVHEAQAASALQHNNICNIHDIEETNEGQTFIVMDCYDGDTLKKKIEGGPLKIDNAVDIALQIAQGLQKAHENGIVHRDIKPANVMLTTDGVAKIVDFGLAKLSGRTVLTKTGSTVGTAAYMSPEQARSEIVDARTDIWSLGVVLYEMLTGKKPFESDYEQALVYSILSQDPKPLRDLRPDVPEAIEKICRRAMAKEAKHRYQTAAELIGDLESFRAGTGLSLKTRRVVTRRRKFLYAAAVCVAATIVVVFLYTRNSGNVFDSVGVLPFEDPDTTRTYFSRNLTDEVIRMLWQIQSLRVPSLKTVMAKVKPGMTYEEIANELGVKTILETRVDQVGNIVKITATLMDPVADRPIGKPFKREQEFSNILMLQSELAQEIVRNVRVQVSKEEQGRLTRPQRKVDPRAYELVVEARRDFGQLTLDVSTSKTRVDSAIAKMRRAIDIESDNASYYATLSDMYEQAIMYAVVKKSDVIEKMKAAVETALRLDPDSWESQCVAGELAYQQYDFGVALSHYARGLELAPGSSILYATRGYALMALGRFDEALVMFRRMIEVDPVAGKRLGFNIGLCYFFMHRYDDAITSLKQWLPHNPFGNIYLAYAYSMKGMHKEALAACDSAVYWGTFARPLFLYRAGQHELALKAFKETLPFQNDFGKAEWFALTGQKDSAFYWLERFAQEPSGEIFWVRTHPLFNNLRDDPRFKEILRKMNLSD